ncbi:MAG: response regulator transcription factor [Chitinophagales bacterium]|nr:response regulator transcription factor [Chitinophagales bacterium]
MKILIVEDEIELQNTIKDSLEKSDFIVETASDYSEGIEKTVSFEYDCILLDIMLPDGSGLKLLEELKAMKREEAVIIVSAKDSLDDKIDGLNLGADDYMTKPFHLAELTARVKAAIRRKNNHGVNFLSWKNLQLDPDNRTAKVDGKDIELNRKEFDLLYYFISNPNRVITKVSIAEYVWGDHTEDADSLDFIYSQIKNLRKKLQQFESDANIKSVYGIGYKFS